MDKKDKIKPYTAHKVFGIIFAVFGGLFILGAIIGMIFEPEEDLGGMLIGGIFFFVNGVLYTNGTFARMELNKKKKLDKCGVYFTDKKDVSFIDGMDGHAFEHFCAELLKKNGFFDVSVTRGSGDQGVDVIAIKDGIKYAVQCKCYTSVLGNTPVQEVNAGKIFYNCHVGVVMTNSTFTKSAVDLARATGTLLWDRKYIQKMMK